MSDYSKNLKGLSNPAAPQQGTESQSYTLRAKKTSVHIPADVQEDSQGVNGLFNSHGFTLKGI